MVVGILCIDALNAASLSYAYIHSLSGGCQVEGNTMIQERLSMYDDLMENDPEMQRLRAKYKTEGLAEGKADMRRLPSQTLAPGRCVRGYTQFPLAARHARL